MIITIRNAILAVSLTFASNVFAESGERDRILEYLEDIGVVEAVALHVDATREMYIESYAFLPNSFWDDARIVSLFDQLAADMLGSYVKVMERDLSEEEIEFLIEFYKTEDGRRAVDLGKRMNPGVISDSTGVSMTFSSEFLKALEEIAIELREGEAEKST